MEKSTGIVHERSNACTYLPARCYDRGAVSMSAPRRNRFVLVTAAAAVVVLLVIYFVPFQRASGSGASECRTLSVAASVPSVAMDQERGIAYLAYLDVAKRSSGRAPRGTIMLMDLNTAEPRVRAALVTEPPDFQPVALSLWAPQHGPRRLFVADHGAGAQSAVQIFEQSPSGAFELVKTVRDVLLVNPNAIVPVGPEKFYARNDPSAGSVLNRIRSWFGVSRSSVTFYDGAKATTSPSHAKAADI